MDGREFRRWVESGLREYTRDPWFFLRELAQNSRDAGAAAIWVNAEQRPGGSEILTFRDNGGGMSYEHACRYLFRLYASSKEQDHHAAGMFGIGFWSVLRIDPRKITIESCTGKSSWAVVLDGELNIEKIPPALKNHGTRVTLEWRSGFGSQEKLLAAVKKALLRYCCYLRKRDGKGTSLPVFFSGENIARPIQAPGPVSLTFKSGSIEGAVGLAAEPQVLLFARGLPVWRGTSLQELFHTTSTKADNCELTRGLAPVFILNGNNLDVNISRNRVLDNRALRRMKKTADAALTRLVRFHADKALPVDFRHFFYRLTDLSKRAYRRCRRSFPAQLALLLIIILPLEVFLLNKFFTPHEKARNTPALFFEEQNRYTGATVKTLSRAAPLDMSYEPPLSTWFKLFAAEKYDPVRGFIRSGDQDRFVFPAPPQRCLNPPLSIRLKLNRGGRIFLPKPAGYTVAPGSLTLNDAPFTGIQFNAAGEAVLTIPEGGGVLRCRCCPATTGNNRIKTLTPQQTTALTGLPREINLPPSIKAELNRYAGHNLGQKVDKAVRLTRTILRYDNSRDTAGQYRNAPDQGDWFLRVSRIGKGDCDIMNGITVIFLRRLGIPARLVIGFTGEEGRVLPGLHAWTEYFHGGWQVVDSSLQPSGAGLPDGNTSPLSHRHAAVPGNAVLYFFITIILSLCPLFFVIYRKKKQKVNITGSTREGDQETTRETLAQMAAGALLRPGLWGYDSHIRYYRILPTLHPEKPGRSIIKKSISLDRALSLAKAGKLLKSHRNNPLARKFTGSGTAVLDKDDPAFRSLINLLPGVIDLDLVLSLKAVPPDQVSRQKVAQLLSRVNKLLKKIKMGCPDCRWAAGLRDREFLDVELPGSARYIAVNPGGRGVEMLAWLFSRNPQLAVYSLIKRLLRESRLFPPLPGSILKKTALILLKEMP